MEIIKACRIIITGRVQNVGFRFHAQDKAQELGVAGFVRNQTDGSVYIEAEGAEEKLNEFVLWCYQGPTWATVINVKAVEQPVQEFTTFEIQR
ncbi:MAG TPA: acylphosphatase [Marinilabiliales bacterium]|jgi:acylphosphatase|nr:MAG: hypothetical protein A2W95_18230 [Bacteroidetes bacterium GWA2_40_14]OFX57265.1 MAG: hypothetical protein A2W84_15360 [Bacteroidetes bacterium GWC2_40_13]OFX72376.1 MAG: hypothetical protein A2W96_17975 [Bacteroidetes bacterium GWD2_40_43]OFX90823.1 MAG: hypothetical protein A2W97_01425 [Bacteroidetes bacterium GWE2_40_63]OFY17382.1 MAG: hypothetical protein A2W88_15440 [Bacteroidetes bacterium GWF2_40_13]OFZ27335.1 MAG: hypothetical protein A2437_13820 [Bacteroidetes bacterium RIFOXYC